MSNAELPEESHLVPANFVPVSIVSVNPADVLPTQHDDPAEREGVGILMADLRDAGQRVPALIARHPELAGKYLNLDGHSRAYCLDVLGMQMQAIIVDGQPSEVEIIKTKFSTNHIRRSLSLDEIHADASRLMELVGGSQQDVASMLKCSKTTMNRAFTLMERIPPELRADARRLGPHFVSAIGPLRDAAKMKAAIDFARTPTEAGNKPSREAVGQYVATLRDDKKPGEGRKAKRLKLTVAGRVVEVERKADDTPDTLAACFEAMFKSFQGKASFDEAIKALITGERAGAGKARAKRRAEPQPALAAGA